MAIAPTGAIYKSLIFDGEDSRNYGVYITGEAVYNAPQRDVEMVSIPGRNGAFALDKGRFENIEVTYPAGIFADNEADFARAVSDFRNYLCSRKGYCRLTDGYNPDEYRMAIYKSGLEVTPAQLKAGEFDIVFDCKPQRWLTSGEELVDVGEWINWETESGPIVEIEATETDAVKSLVADIEPIQSGSGTPSPSNIRPISGYDSVETSVAKKNIFDKSAITSGYLVGHGTGELAQNANYGASDYIPIKAGHTYTYSGTGTDTFNYWYSTFYDANKQVSAEIPPSTKSFTVPDGVCFLRTTVVLTKLDVAQLEQGTTTTDYEPYNGDTYTIDLDGTRYGGKIDVTSGVLTVDRAIITYDGSSDEEWWSSSGTGYYQFMIAVTDALNSVNAITNRFEKIDLADRGTKTGLVSYENDTTFRFSLNSSLGVTTTAEWKTWLGSNNVQLVYELATPITVQLTAQQVSALVGTNNVWANSGDVTVEYGTAPNVLVNPTLFDSSPLLEMEGYGTIGFNGYEIELGSNEIGEILIADATSGQTTVTFDTSRLLSGDDINAAASAPYLVGAYVTISGAEGYYVDAPYQKTTTNFIYGSVSRSSGYFDYGVPETPWDHGAGVSSHKIYNGNGEYINKQAFFNFRFILAYDGADTLNISYELRDQVNMEYITVDSVTFLTAPIYGESSKTIERAYIDCELGEAYCIDGGSIISLNQRVDLGSDLPKLASGANEITYDNTITNLKVHPRWWKV